MFGSKNKEIGGLRSIVRMRGYEIDELERKNKLLADGLDVLAQANAAMWNRLERVRIALEDDPPADESLPPGSNFTEDLTIDHIVPLSDGGSHSLDNLCVACTSCNCSKGAKDLDEWIEWKDRIAEELGTGGDAI